MSLNANRVSERIISKFSDIGIEKRVGKDDSHTAKLIKEIIGEIFEELTSNGVVIIQNLPVSTPTGPGIGNGKGFIK